MRSRICSDCSRIYFSLSKPRDQAEIVIAINAGDIEKNKRRGDLGITYDKDVARLKIGQKIMIPKK